MGSPLNYQIDVSSSLTTPGGSRPPLAATTDTNDLLRSLIEVQRESLQVQRAAIANQDHLARWKGFLSRWNGEFPDLGEQCKKTVPVLERTFARMIQEVLDRLADEETLDNDFALQDLLERYGVRLAQLGTLINLVTPLADATPNTETPPHS